MPKDYRLFLAAVIVAMGAFVLSPVWREMLLAAVAAFLLWPTYQYMLIAAACAAIYAWRKRDRELLITACSTPPCFLLGFAAAYKVSTSTSRILDTTFARLDHGVGIAVWHWCSFRHPVTMLLLGPVYTLLPAVIIAALTFSERRTEFLRAAMLTWALGGIVCYYFFPAVGPVHVGQPQAMRNCMPSLHLTFAMLCWLYASRFRPFFALFAVLTAIATMATGEHYFIDLVAAVPFTACVAVAVTYRQTVGASHAIPCDKNMEPLDGTVPQAYSATADTASPDIATRGFLREPREEPSLSIGFSIRK